MSNVPWLLFGCAVLVGCDAGGGGSNEGAGGQPGGIVTNIDRGLDRGPTDRRIRASRTDVGGDGTVDASIVHAYDDDGRIVSETREFSGSRSPQVIVYQYEEGRLVTKSDGTDTVTYGYENGRVVEIEDSFDERATFRYDAAGRLAAFFQSEFPDDDDLAPVPGEPFPPDPIAEIVEVVVSYESGRPTLLAWQNDSRTSRYRYDADGLPIAIEDTDGNGRPESTLTLTRDERGRVVALDDVVEPDEFDPFGTIARSVRLTYEADRLATVVFTGDVLFGGRVERRGVFDYTEDGLLDSLTVTERALPDGAERLAEIVRYEYESPGCAPQATNDPRAALAIEFIGATRASTAALECGYWVDDEL